MFVPKREGWLEKSEEPISKEQTLAPPCVPARAFCVAHVLRDTVQSQHSAFDLQNCELNKRLCSLIQPQTFCYRHREQTYIVDEVHLFFGYHG